MGAADDALPLGATYLGIVSYTFLLSTWLFVGMACLRGAGDTLSAMQIMMLVNGILNILAGLGITAGVVITTVGIGLVCTPITILPAVLGVFEVIAASRLLTDPVRPVKNLQTIAISPWLLAPAVPVIIVILASNFLGDGLRDAADPYG